jgi:hypothetical protein
VRLPRSPCAYSSGFQKSEHSSITTSHFSDILFVDASERQRIFRKEGLHARQGTAGVQLYFLVIRGATCFLLSSNTQPGGAYCKFLSVFLTKTRHLPSNYVVKFSAPKVKLSALGLVSLVYFRLIYAVSFLQNSTLTALDVSSRGVSFSHQSCTASQTAPRVDCKFGLEIWSGAAEYVSSSLVRRSL